MWYQPFMFVVALVWVCSTERDRPAARVILLATLGSYLIVELVTHRIHGSWKLVVPGAIETLTILALYRWAHNRTGLMQALCLVVAWAAHFLCYVDCRLKTDIVYSRYETILGVVAFAQIIAFHDTFAKIGCVAGAWFRSSGTNRAGALRAPSICASVLRDTGHIST